MKTIKIVGGLFVMALFFQSCMADLRTRTIKKEGITLTNSEKGKLILKNSWEKQGIKHFKKHTVYSVYGTDNWKGMMGEIRPENQSKLNIKFEVGTFDSQISFLDGKRKDNRAGLQNWNYYEIGNNGSIELIKTNKRIGFGLPAFHYFFERIDRLSQAPIISYAGESEFRNENFDLIFCSWNNEKPNKAANQYILWINKKTDLLQYAEYTIRENYLKMPGAKTMHGSIEFVDFKNIDGVMIPFEQTIYIGTMAKKINKYLHQFKVSEFDFDNFDPSILKPKTNLTSSGNFKN